MLIKNSKTIKGFSVDSNLQTSLATRQEVIKLPDISKLQTSDLGRLFINPSGHLNILKAFKYAFKL